MRNASHAGGDGSSSTATRLKRRSTAGSDEAKGVAERCEERYRCAGYKGRLQRGGVVLVDGGVESVGDRYETGPALDCRVESRPSRGGGGGGGERDRDEPRLTIELV